MQCTARSGSKKKQNSEKFFNLIDQLFYGKVRAIVSNPLKRDMINETVTKNDNS